MKIYTECGTTFTITATYEELNKIQLAWQNSQRGLCREREAGRTVLEKLMEMFTNGKIHGEAECDICEGEK